MFPEKQKSLYFLICVFRTLDSLSEVGQRCTADVPFRHKAAH